MMERTVTTNGLSKTYSVTGWRVGYILANPQLTGAIRKVYDFLRVGAAPLQRAGVTAMQLSQAYYQELATPYQEKRDNILQTLDEVDIPYFVPKEAGHAFIRFCFSKRPETLQVARERLLKLKPTPHLAI